jgi:hypothetical protein
MELECAGQVLGLRQGTREQRATAKVQGSWRDCCCSQPLEEGPAHRYAFSPSQSLVMSKDHVGIYDIGMSFWVVSANPTPPSTRGADHTSVT